jgi:uncharacterized NAD(P)/FAD-binding protein YdhS
MSMPLPPARAHGCVDQLPVLASLAAQDVLQADPLGLGIAVDPLGRAIGADRLGDPRLYDVGPLARERYGELMGLPMKSAGYWRSRVWRTAFLKPPVQLP